MEQESNREKRFAFLENVKQYQVKSEEQVRDIEKYIEHLRLRYAQAKEKLGKEENNKKVEAYQKKLKRLGDIFGKEAYKIATHFPDHVMIILDELILLAKQHMNTLTVQLIMNFLSPEVKCQSFSHEHKESHKMTQQHTTPQVIALPPQQESIIALPYNNQSLVIVNANPSDIAGQQLRQESEKYFAEDDLRVAEYLDKRFVTVERQGISEIFMQCAEKIVIQFIQPLMNDELIHKLTVDQLISCLKLICHISPSLYTYYLLSLLKSFSETILQCFSNIQTKDSQKIILQKGLLATELQNKIKKSQYEEIVYLIKSLAERWTEHKSEFNVKVWEWKVEQCMILTFLSSTVSEKQLYSIKTLIDRIRKTQYSSYSAVNEQLLLEFIQSHSVIQKIFHPQNHPEVIIKGKQVFEFIVKNSSLTKQMIDIIFQLIIKSNESLGKGLYQTLYSIGHQNLQANRQYILSRINSLPRASLFYEETFNLIQALILFSPLENLRQSLQYTCMIIRGYYMALKAQAQHKLLNIYFEVYLMGVEEGVFGDSEDDVMVCLKPFLQVKEYKNEDEYELVFLMIDRFLEKLKQQLPKKLGHKCKHILNTAIKFLFSKYKIHKQSQTHFKNIIIDESKERQLRKNQLELIKQLIESSEKQEIVNMLPQKQLWQLIEEEPQFGRFLSFYSKESQQFLLEKLLKKENVTEGDVKNIIQVYYFMDEEMREKVFVNIFELFLCMRDVTIKRKLVEFVVKEGQFTGEHMQRLILEEMIEIEQLCIEKIDIQFVQRLQGKLILLKQSLLYNDTIHGYDHNPPFKYITNSYPIHIKVLNMIDVLNPMTFQIQQKHYNTLKSCLLRILPIVGRRQLTQINVKLDKTQKQVTLEQLNWRLNQLTVERELSLTILQGSQSAWYDQSLLINYKTNELNQRISNVLKQVFGHYSSESREEINVVNKMKNKGGRLFKNQACRIFAIATNVEDISPHDVRILHLFNNYSQTGEYLTIDEWVNFYYQSALTNPQLVIDNLRNLGYAEVFNNIGNNIGIVVKSNTQEESMKQQNINKNKFRSYFANTQSIFTQLIKMYSLLEEMSTNNYINKKTIQQSLYLIVQLFKQLPTWKQLQDSLEKEFRTNNDVSDEKINKENIQEEETSNFLLMYLITCFTVNLMDDKQNVKINEVDMKKIGKYCIQMSHILCKYLTEELQQVIDPLQLQCNEQLTIWALQNVEKVLCGKGGLRGIQQVKIMLSKDISELTPFQNGQVNNFQESKQMNQFSCKSATKLFIKQLSQLCAINTDLVTTYCALILWQLMKQCEQKQYLHKQKYLTVSKQFLMKLISYNGVDLSIQDNQHDLKSQQQSSPNPLQSLSNKLVYLLIQNIQGLKHWFMTQLLEQKVNELTTYNDWRRNKRIVVYLQTLSQIIILESDHSQIVKVYQQLQRLIEFIVKEKYQKDLQNSLYDHRQERTICQIQQKLTQNTLACMKNVILNMHFMGLHNNDNLEYDVRTITSDNIMTLCQNILISHQLTPISQSHCYQILSTITPQESNQINTTSFLNTILSTVTLKKNSKPNTAQNQSQCGIYNLGCICYINSVFQQLYHVDMFRKVIMSSTIYMKGNAGGKLDQHQHQHQHQHQLMKMQQQEQPYFKQFRKIFYQLMYSNRQFITTEEFCLAYTDSNNQPINIKQQHDADQFLNQLLDRLQKTYQLIYHIPKHQTIINQLFQGTMSNVITCQNCLTNKVNQEEFYILSLEIKNLSTLKECLDKMVQPEVICDYFCTVCDKKVGEIQKYRKFSSLPKILFIHFQRLVFDLQSFSKVKLENPVNFAEQIDLSQYFYQSLSNDQCAKYRLLGFIVHFGNSQGGHYISLIKHNQGKGGWRKYDDSRIIKWFWKTGIHEKDNAYLLIYERIQTDESGFEPTDRKQDLSMQISKQLIQQINDDNSQLNKQLTVTREQFCQFLIRELQKQKPAKYYKKQNNNDEQMEQEQLLQEREIQFLLRCKLIWKYLSIIEQAKSIGIGGNDPLMPMVRDHELEKITRIFLALNTLPESAQYFLNIIVEQQALKLLYKPADKKLRETYKWVIANVIIQWARFSCAEEQVLSFLVPSLENQTIRKLLWQVENLLNEVGKSPTKMDEYFEFLLIIIKLVPKIKEYFSEMNIVAKLIHFIMQKESKLIKEIGHYYPLTTTGKKVQCFNVIISIIGEYVEEYPEHILQEKKLRKCLGVQNIQFYKKLYLQRYQNYHQLNSILARFCHNNPTTTNKVINQLIIPNLNRFNHQDSYVITYIDLVYLLLRIDDENRGYRMYRMLGIPMLRDVLSGDAMIKRKGQRIAGYWSNLIIDSDEIMFPLLELMYNNRENINYFQLSAIMCLLKLMVENDLICQYVISLPSPCFAYENYLTWIRHEFLKNAIKQFSCIKLQRIDLKQCLQKIGRMLQQIDNKVIEGQIGENKHHFIDEKGWMQRNSPYLLGEMTEKLETRLITVQIIMNDSLQKNDDSSIIDIPLTYMILKTCRVTDWKEYAKEVRDNLEIIQPHEEYEDPKVRRGRFQALLKEKYCLYDKSDSTLLQIWFSGDNQQLLPYRGTQSMLKVSFSYPQYPYEIFISVQKLINSQFKLIVPCPQKCKEVLNNECKIQYNEVDKLIGEVMSFEIVSESKKHIISGEMKQKHNEKEITYQKEYKKQEQKEHQNKQNDITNQPFPTMDQAIAMNDAFIQSTQNTSNYQDQTKNIKEKQKKQQICIQCPFCGYIAHEFVSRCPGCNEEWGLYA